MSLSYRDIEKMRLYRSINVTHESIGKWYEQFAQVNANQICRRRPKLKDRWHLDETEATQEG